jgi:GT2 family glycosyltransferase
MRHNEKDAMRTGEIVDPGVSIASLTVVYNGAAALSRHLDALKRQTRRLDEIVVVNNASTDDTLKLLAGNYPEVKVLNASENGGVGGGLAAGLAYAIDIRKHDWVWTFDQDSLPSVDCLALLLNGLRQLDDRANRTVIVAPICVHPETRMTSAGLSWCGSRLVETPTNGTRPVALVDSAITAGSLIRSDAVLEAGLPRADFFMDFVDHEYCLRLRRHGFDIAIVRDSVLNHSLGEPSKFRVFGKTKFWTDHVPWREYYMTRNEIFTIWRYYRSWKIKTLTVYRLFRHGVALVLFGKRKLACLRMMSRGFIDGLSGRLGVRFGADSSAATGSNGC